MASSAEDRLVEVLAEYTDAINAEVGENADMKDGEELIARSVRAYACCGNSIKQQVAIIDGYIYWDHHVHPFTANPPLGKEDGKWSHRVSFELQFNRIAAVIVDVRTQNTATFGARNWLGVELTVTMKKK